MKQLTIYLGALTLVTTVMAATTTPKGPVKIFLLSGQSNMTGRGTLGNLKSPAENQKASLVRFIKEPENLEKYKFLYNGEQKTSSGWKIRDDVFITIGSWPHIKRGEEGFDKYRQHGGLSPHYGGFRNKGFGPELGIGHALGNYYDEPVLLVKVAYGSNSLGGNFRPPSSGGALGDKYPSLIERVEEGIAHIKEIIPDCDEKQGCEIVGFCWNQGLSDTRVTELAAEYEENLANLIKDLRKELKAPEMKAVIAVTGNYGWNLADALKWQKTQERKDQFKARFMNVVNAQIAVAKRPEFKGAVAYAETRDFWRPREKFGGNKQGNHWHGNGESYWLIGEAMGKEMVKLLSGGSTKGQR